MVKVLTLVNAMVVCMSIKCRKSRRPLVPECRCGAYAPGDQRYCNLCGREINPSGRAVLISEQARPAKKGTARGSPLVADDRPAIWDYYGAPDEKPEYSQRPKSRPPPKPSIVLDDSPRPERRRKSKGGPHVLQIIRRIKSVFQNPRSRHRISVGASRPGHGSDHTTDGSTGCAAHSS
jgi:hypothetical protein